MCLDEKDVSSHSSHHDDSIPISDVPTGRKSSPSPSSPSSSFPSIFLCRLTQELFQDPIVTHDGETYERLAFLKHGDGQEDSMTVNDKKKNHDNITDDTDHHHDKKEDGNGAGEGLLLYPNRALKVIMQDTLLERSDSIHANFRRWQYKTKKIISQYLQEATTPSSSFLAADEGGEDIEDPTDGLSQNNKTEDDDGNNNNQNDMMMMVMSSSSPSSSFPLSDGFYCPITCNIMYDPVIDPDGNTFERVVVENWIKIHGSSPTTRRKMTVNDLRPNRIVQKLLEGEKHRPKNLIRPEILLWIQERAPKTSDVEYGGGMILSSTTAATDAAAAAAAVNLVQEYRPRASMQQLVFNIVMGTILVLGIWFMLFHYLGKLTPSE